MCLYKQIPLSEIQFAQLFINSPSFPISLKKDKQTPNKSGILTIRSHVVSENRSQYIEKKKKKEKPKSDCIDFDSMFERICTFVDTYLTSSADP